ncbi:MAG TPA: bifunctional adenosylcobinamide kinase/adenosylcobinamide-phosphate guanylyltransferase [Polyangia bacterium]|nr:bifunctional adenosylcobinamide kinase/adenosylcobinamide-phosphate guanylyltransferase [Polyangia bacterium]
MSAAGGPLVLVGGGARSGKSRFALARALALGEGGVFVATAEGSDDEMRARIARHREERGERLRTVEAPLDLPGALRRIFEEDRAADVVLVDCLTLWLSNLLVKGESADEALRRVEELRGVLARRRLPIVLVTNEVGMGLVPETPLGRTFRDVAGLAHQRLARDADEVHVGVLGLMLRLRPGPIAVSEPGP